METIYLKKQADQLIFLGVLLFLLGLIVGLVVPVLANPRMGLSSHLEGVMNGMLLIIFGLIWNRLKLSVKWLKITFWMAIYGTFANWFGILIAAIFNAGKMLTVAAKGQEGHPVAEAVVTFCLVTLTLAMLFVSVVILIGLARGTRSKNAES
jgi:(hydroxyamino)benzene mutase